MGYRFSFNLKMGKSNQRVWLAYYTELYMHCKDCAYYHVQSHEKGRNSMQTTHRCKKITKSDPQYLPEYSRGYYPRLDIGCICPISGKMITSKTFIEVQILANSSVISSEGVICCGNKVELKAVNRHILVGHCPVCGKSIAIQV